MDNNLQDGITAAKVGDASRAFELLTRASENPATAEQAWLWLSGVVSEDAERLFCLDNVLKVNPGNQAAQRGASLLRQKGVFPAIPVYPEPRRVPPGQALSSKPSSFAQEPKLRYAGTARGSKTFTPDSRSGSKTGSMLEMDWNKQNVSSLFQYAAMELANAKPRKEIEKELVKRGASSKEAKTIVADAQYTLKKGRREKYKKRLIRGLIWTVLGVIVTCGTYAFASQLGGKFYLFYGAIILGFIDFMIGLIGWLTNS